MLTCAVCNSSTLTLIHKLYDDRYGYPGYFKIYRCAKCSHKTLDGSFSAASLSELYSNYYPRATFNEKDHRPYAETGGFMAWVNGSYRSAFRWVPGNVRVLDIGCGFGESIGYHKARGCEVWGVEADENVRRVAERFGYNIHIGIFDPEVYPSGSFDYVTMDQVIEHVLDPIKTLKGVAKVLRKDGVAILSTPNSNGWGAKVFGRKWMNWHAPYHLQHFSKESMKIASDQSGLILEKCRTITSSEWLYWQWLHLLTYPGIGEPSSFWSRGKGSGVKNNVVRKFLWLAHLAKINHVVTRTFDTIGHGDNYLFFLRKR